MSYRRLMCFLCCIVFLGCILFSSIAWSAGPSPTNIKIEVKAYGSTFSCSCTPRPWRFDELMSGDPSTLSERFEEAYDGSCVESFAQVTMKEARMHLTGTENENEYYSIPLNRVMKFGVNYTPNVINGIQYHSCTSDYADGQGSIIDISNKPSNAEYPFYVIFDVVCTTYSGNNNVVNVKKKTITKSINSGSFLNLNILDCNSL